MNEYNYQSIVRSKYRFHIIMQNFVNFSPRKTAHGTYLISQNFQIEEKKKAEKNLIFFSFTEITNLRNRIG